MDGLTGTLLITNNQDHEMARLLEQIEVLVTKPDLLSDREKENLGDLFSKVVKWNDHSSDFEDYFQQFSQMMAAMADSDFSKRLPVSGFKKNLLNYVALGLNTVNEELGVNNINKAFFTSIEDVSSYGIIFTDLDYKILEVNQNMLDKTGYQKEQIEGLSILKNLVGSKQDVEKITSSESLENLFFCMFKDSKNDTFQCKVALKRVQNGLQHIGYSFIIYDFGERI